MNSSCIHHCLQFFLPKSAQNKSKSVFYSKEEVVEEEKIKQKDQSISSVRREKKNRKKRKIDSQNTLTTRS